MFHKSRPGGRRCDRCQSYFEYRELEQVPRTQGKRKLVLCLDCLVALGRLSMIRWP